MRRAASDSSGSSSSSSPGSATTPTLPPRSMQIGTPSGGRLFRRELAEPGAAHRREQVVAARLLVVPRERELAHQVRVRVLETVVIAQRAGEAADASLA